MPPHIVSFVDVNLDETAETKVKGSKRAGGFRSADISRVLKFQCGKISWQAADYEARIKAAGEVQIVPKVPKIPKQKPVIKLSRFISSPFSDSFANGGDDGTLNDYGNRDEFDK